MYWLDRGFMCFVPFHSAENSTKDHPEESEKKRLGMKETFTIVNLCIAGLSVGVYYAVLGPFFPQEVRN